MSTPLFRVIAAPALWLAAVTVTSSAMAAQAVDAEPADPATSPAWQWPDPVTSASELLPRAADALMLDVLTLADGRHVAVGERGHVLVSDDQGNGWRQVQVPTRSTLTALAAAGDTLVAVGHDGVILHSDDAGDSWQRVREEPYSPDNHHSLSNGSPLLDVMFLDQRRVLAIGAYTLMLASDDGGRSWQPREMVLAEDAPGQVSDQSEDPSASADPGMQDLDQTADDEPDTWSDAFLFSDDDLLLGDEADPHLNALTRLADGRLVLVGERGSAWRSDDEGATWQRLALPYAGSMYGLLAGPGQAVIAFGLRGRVLESADGGDSWQLLETASLATLFDGIFNADGEVILVGGQGRILRRGAGSDAFVASTHVDGNGETPTLAGIVALPDGRFLVAGERGVDIWEGR